ncbi:MAG TPA: tetratricopeptide repeat protein [Planctomycetota bacterium]|jgi:tetratricopeptide (TPR) repeat protein
MKRLAGLAAFVLFSFACASAGEAGSRERVFVQALEKFDNAKGVQDYKDSAALLEGLLQDGYQNGAVYYNLGNAHMRAGQYGYAIAAYRKAKLFRPRDAYLDANLRQALMEAPGHLPESATPWWKNVLFWSGWLSYPEKFWLVAAWFGSGAILACLALLLRRGRLYWASGALVAVALVLSIDAALAYSEVNYARRAVVVQESVARKGMGTNYEPAFDKPLKDGAEFTIIDRSGPWVFGHFEGIGDGWLRREAIAE